MTSEWGNPHSKTFRKMNIRQVRSSGSTVLVHREIADIAAEVLRVIEDEGTYLPENLAGWVPFSGSPDYLDTYREFGLAFQVHPSMTEEQVPEGFILHRDGAGRFLIWTDTIEHAQEAAGRIEAERVIRLSPPELPKSSGGWQSSLPGVRTLRTGDRGDDVQFVQYALASPCPEGVFDAFTEAAVKSLQNRFGINVTGVMDEDSWKALLPTSLNMAVTYGETGPVVRVLQAALLAYDWEPDVVVSGRFCPVTLRGVKHLQDTYGLRQTGNMGGPEWAALLGKPVRNV